MELRQDGSNRLFAIVLLVLCAVGLVLYLTKNAGGGTPAESAGSHGVEISEVMTSNKGTVPDENGDFPDWIELHNTTGSKIDIGGFGLSDSPLGVVKWAIPAGTEIEPNGYLIIYCSGTLDGGPLHAAFKLSASDVLTLSTDGGAVIEQVQLKAVASGMTLAKDAGGAFVEMSPSPGYPNTPEGQAAFVSTLSAGAGEDIGVYLNEFMAVQYHGQHDRPFRLRHFGLVRAAAEIHPARWHEDRAERRSAHILHGTRRHVEHGDRSAFRSARLSGGDRVLDPCGKDP